MKVLYILLLVLASVGFVFAARPDEEGITFGVSNANIIVSAVLGPTAAGGGGATSTLEIRNIFVGGEALKNHKTICVYWLDAKDSGRVLSTSGHGKCFLWFLAPHTNQQAYVETVGCKYPFIEANAENIAFLKSILTKKNLPDNAVEPTNALAGARGLP